MMPLAGGSWWSRVRLLVDAVGRLAERVTGLIWVDLKASVRIAR